MVVVKNSQVVIGRCFARLSSESGFQGSLRVHRVRCAAAWQYRSWVLKCGRPSLPTRDS